MLDCGAQIVKAEGVSSLFKGAGANILRGVAGAGTSCHFLISMVTKAFNLC